MQKEMLKISLHRRKLYEPEGKEKTGQAEESLQGAVLSFLSPTSLLTYP